MNKWKEVAGLFYLELEEEFYIDYWGSTSNHRYKFTKDGLFYCEAKTWYPATNETVIRLLDDTYKVSKLPWKPKYGDTYWFVSGFKDYGVNSGTWIDDSTDYTRWKVGNYFRTEDEAWEKGIALMEKIAEEFENE